MRVLSGFVPAVAAFSSLAHAASSSIQMDPKSVLASIATPKAPATTSTKPINRAAMATSIVASLSSQHAKTVIQTTSSVKPTTSAKKSPTTKAEKSSTAKVEKSSIAKAASAKEVLSTSAKKVSSTSAKKVSSSKKNVKRAVTTSSTTTTTTTTTTTSATPSCTNLEVNLLGYTPANNTPAGFITDPTMVNTALAAWLAPAGYTQAFTGAVGQVQQANGVSGAYQLATYDPSACAAMCNGQSTCQGFNIVYQRNPLYIADQSCRNPAARAAVLCVLWTNPVDVSQAVNYGQYRVDFMIVNTGSNGYNKNNPAATRQTNFTAPVALQGAINGLSSSLYMGYYFWATAPDWTKCASLCTAQSASNRAAAIAGSKTSYTACNMYNGLNLTYQGAYQGFYCLLYSDPSALSSGVVNSFTSGAYVYNLTNSYYASLYPADTGLVANTWKPSPTGSNATCLAVAPTVGQSLIDGNQVNYTVACGYDVYLSLDIGNAPYPDFYQCFNACDNFANCSGFAYRNNICYFKNFTGSTKIPTLDANVTQNIGADLAWLPAKYGGFSANSVAATITYTTYTTAWTGAATATTTSFNGLTAYVIVQTPGATVSSVTPGGTVTVTSYVDSGTASTIGSITSAATSGTQVVKVIYPTPVQTCGNVGVEYALYSNKWPGGQATVSYPAYTPQAYKTVTPLAQGSASYVGESNDAGSTVTVYGNKVVADTLAIANTFYVYAGRGSGYYSFQIPYTDDIQFIWVGGKAVSGWTRANTDLYQYWPNSNAVTVAFYLAFGTYTPVRVHWANGGGIGSMQFNLFAPDGSYLLSSSGLNSGTISPQIVQNPCNATLGAAFPNWGSET